MIVLNDNHNTFEHVASTLARVIPGMSIDGGYQIADQDPHQRAGDRLERRPGGGRALLGAAERGGLTMAPLERG